MSPASPAPSPQAPQDSAPAGLLTELLDRWAEERGARRAFTAVAFDGPASPGTHTTVTWSALRTRALAVARRLAAGTAQGDRVALLLPQGLDYVTAFLGCLYAGVVAVPLFTPGLPGHEGRLSAVLADCAPACLLTDSANEPAVREAAEDPAPDAGVLCVDRIQDAQLPDSEGELREGVRAGGPEDAAYLQYTSGSTRTPAGVVISHRNVAANARQAVEAYAADPAVTTTVGWLPLFHDMGLVLSVAAPLYGGFPSVLMDPVAFLELPVRWLRLLSRYPGAVSAAPNFAYDYCVSRTGEEAREGLRLERVRALINGSEPVRPATVERFGAAFAPYGLRAEAQCPSYGLAEATVFVCADPPEREPSQLAVDRAALNDGKVVPVAAGDEGALHLVACGTPAGQRLRVVAPDTGAPLPEDTVGEIWLQGPNTGRGYRNRPELSAETFAARLHGEEGLWLRTGDLGALHEGELLVTGRLKDLVIVDGRNHYPHDIEETVQERLPLVRRDRAAAFTVPAADPAAGGEQLVVVAEHRREAEPDADTRAAALVAARAAVSSGHGVRLADLRLVEPGVIPRTSSGKVSRTACRARYLEGAL
ncbi:fatty acyl-AMP ligase [Streptomyces sp. ODS28]|uniref:fatty acyl-AMP ligase n=1 Tax=Streptomyces sp. ODS28 TaxID=3136688 RepID=UPI0031E611A4